MLGQHEEILQIKRRLRKKGAVCEKVKCVTDRFAIDFRQKNFEITRLTETMSAESLNGPGIGTFQLLVVRQRIDQADDQWHVAFECLSNLYVLVNRHLLFRKR